MLLPPPGPDWNPPLWPSSPWLRGSVGCDICHWGRVWVSGTSKGSIWCFQHVQGQWALFHRGWGPPWCLTLKVTLTKPRGAQMNNHFWVYLQVRLWMWFTFELVDSVGYASQCRGAASNLIGILRRAKRKGKMHPFLLPTCLLSWDIHFLVLWTAAVLPASLGQ